MLQAGLSPGVGETGGVGEKVGVTTLPKPDLLFALSYQA